MANCLWCGGKSKRGAARTSWALGPGLDEEQRRADEEMGADAHSPQGGLARGQKTGRAATVMRSPPFLRAGPVATSRRAKPGSV
jgi:hypothetical protein